MNYQIKSGDIINSLKAKLNKAIETANHWELLANTDDLTGLHNRRMLNNVDKKIANRRNASIADEITLLFIDLDDFGKLNKKYGDDMGDEALRLLGHAIQKNIRTDDIAIRKGGDEFVIILMGSNPETASETIVKRLQLMLDGELLLYIANISIPIRGSIGVFSYNRSLSPFENLKHADELMRRQKQVRKAFITPSPIMLSSGQYQSDIL